MTSAFGIDHGYVSKGFRNPFRIPKPVNLELPIKPPGPANRKLVQSGQKTVKRTQGSTYTMAKDTARIYGRSAGRSSGAQRDLHQMMGAEAKRTSRRMLQESNAYGAKYQRRYLP